MNITEKLHINMGCNMLITTTLHNIIQFLMETVPTSFHNVSMLADYSLKL
jgi:hypothetical protein